MTWDSSEKYRHKGQRLVTDIADRGVTTSHHQPTASYGPKVFPLDQYHHLQQMKAMSLLPNSWIKWSQLSCLWCDQLLVPNFEPVVVGWIGSTIGVALHTLAHYALERPKTWFAYKNYTKKQYSSGINIRKTYKVQRRYTEHENNIICVYVYGKVDILDWSIILTQI